MAPEDASEIKKLTQRVYKLLVGVFLVVIMGTGTLTVIAVTNKANIKHLNNTALTEKDYSHLYVLLSNHIATLDLYIIANDRDKATIKDLLEESRKQLNDHLQYHIEALVGPTRGAG